MRALAEFIMRGRPQAGGVAALGYIVPLLGPIAVALVTLRKGVHEGGVVLLLALAPAVLSTIFGGGAPILIIVVLLLAYILSLILRATVSLPFTVICGLCVSIGIAGIIALFVPETMDRMIEVLHKQVAVSKLDSAEKISGLVACILLINTTVGLLLGRWLQALAFNPGGFREEFCSFRLGLGASIICFVGSLLGYYQGGSYVWWASTLAFPLLLVALAIAHSIARARHLPLLWLILYYFMAIAFMPAVVCVGFIDVWVNFRDRLSKK
ncbi:hypothetical protein AB835_07205 [Candidatus Endobugula sertula]|uniref:DUF2232 domain-containing protein n=1 Tax=Candidatus Endobugula sertula TaxID=62101 RepID=A0A1D2QQE4_9GAMM|nr:hypothetical protein AB835_07205 [Candidatus Endobugula sertula]